MQKNYLLSSCACSTCWDPDNPQTWRVPVLPGRSRWLKQAVTLKFQRDNLDAQRDFVDVRDAVRAFMLAAEKGTARTSL